MGGGGKARETFNWMYLLDEGYIGIAFHCKRLLVSNKIPNPGIEVLGFPYEPRISVKEGLERAFAYQQFGDLFIG